MAFYFSVRFHSHGVIELFTIISRNNSCTYLFTSYVLSPFFVRYTLSCLVHFPNFVFVPPLSFRSGSRTVEPSGRSDARLHSRIRTASAAAAAARAVALSPPPPPLFHSWTLQLVPRCTTHRRRPRRRPRARPSPVPLTMYRRRRLQLGLFLRRPCSALTEAFTVTTEGWAVISPAIIRG